MWHIARRKGRYGNCLSINNKQDKKRFEQSIDHKLRSIRSLQLWNYSIDSYFNLLRPNTHATLKSWDKLSLLTQAVRVSEMELHLAAFLRSTKRGQEGFCSQLSSLSVLVTHGW